MLFLLLCGVFLAWLLCSYSYRHYWHKGLFVELTFLDDVLYEGDTSSLKEIVINDKILPLPALEISFSTNRNLEFLNEAGRNSSATDWRYRRDVFSLLFHQKVVRTLPFTAARRGIYKIDEVSVTGMDFFFYADYYMTLPQQAVLCVYPRQADVSRIALLYRAISGMVLSRSRLCPDPFEFAGIREYRREDAMRRINWKASARTGKLMVNQFDATTSVSLTLLFDLEDNLILKYGDLVEETIRITSSLAARLVKEQMPFWLGSNATDGTDDLPVSMQVPASAGALALLNRRLTCIDAARTLLCAEELLKQAAGEKKTGHTYVWISKNREEKLIRALCSLAAGNNQVLWVVPVYSSELPSVRSIREQGITVFPWEL